MGNRLILYAQKNEISCGIVEAYVLLSASCISRIKLYGDFLGEEPVSELEKILTDLCINLMPWKQHSLNAMWKAVSEVLMQLIFSSCFWLKKDLHPLVSVIKHFNCIPAPVPPFFFPVQP
jgi:hypothetical protein